MLIKSKFFTPKTKAEWISRDHLSLLDECSIRDANLTVIHAPAGYGKTTLVAQQLQQSELDYVWLTLDVHDNHPARFWRYFIAAFQKLAPGVGEFAQQKLREGQFSSIDDIVSSLVNDLIERSGSRPGVLVLDDFHLITDPDIVLGVQHCVRYLPESFHILIVSRTEINVSRQRYGERPVRVYAFSDLKLTATQIQLMLCKRFAEAVGEHVAEAVFNLTDGWVVGVQLLCMQLSSVEHLQSHINSIANSPARLPEQVVGYFIREVINDLEPWEQSSLLSLGLLPKLSIDLCQNVLGGTVDYGSLLQRLESKALLTATEDRHTELRFHDLFRNVLLELAQQRLPAEAIVQVQHRAIQYLQQYDGLEAAFYYAIEIQQWSEACDCLQSMLLSYRRQGDFLRVSECVERLPNDYIESSLSILIHYCWSLANLGHFQLMRLFLDKGSLIVESMHARLPLDQWSLEDKELVVEFMTTVALAQRLSGYLGSEYSEALWGFARQIDYPRLSKVNLEQGMDAFLLGELDRAAILFERSMDCAVNDKEPYALMVAVSFFYLTALQTGQLQSAMAKLELMQQWLGVTHEHQHEFVSAMVVDFCLAGLRYELSLPIDRERLQRQLSLLTGAHANHHMKWLSLDFYTKLCMKDADYPAAAESLQKLIELDRCARFRIRMGAPSLSALTAELAMHTGDRVAVNQWARSLELSESPMISYDQVPDRLLLARAYYYLGVYEKAYHLAEELFGLCVSHQRNGHALMASCISLASYLALQGDVVVDEKVDRIVRLIQQTQFHRYIDELMQAFPVLCSISELASSRVTAPPHTDLVALDTDVKSVMEPLSLREREVLRAAAQGLSNGDIAERLYISINTVKTHLKKIYGKIEVSNRTQALRKAHLLGILEEFD